MTVTILIYSIEIAVIIIFITRCTRSRLTPVPRLPPRLWLRTNGVNTNGAGAKVMSFDRLGKKVRPGTFGKIKVG